MDVAATSDVMVSITAAEQVLHLTSRSRSSENNTSNADEGFWIKISSPQRSIRVDTQLSLDMTKMSPASTPNKPPKIPIQYPSRKHSLSRSSYSKPKSRLVEPSYPSDMSLLEENFPMLGARSLAKASPRANGSTPKASQTPITQKTPLTAAQGVDDEDEEEDEIYNLMFKQARNQVKRSKSQA